MGKPAGWENRCRSFYGDVAKSNQSEAPFQPDRRRLPLPRFDRCRVHGVAMTPAEARQALAATGYTVADLTETLIQLGDARKHVTIERCCHNIFAADRTDNMPWSVHLMLYFLTMYKEEEKKNSNLSELMLNGFNKDLVTLPVKKRRRIKNHHEKEKINAGMSPLEAKALLNQAVLTVEDLSIILLAMGDPRSLQTIERGFYNAISPGRHAGQTRYVPWSVAAMLRFVVELRRIALGETYETRFIAHQRRLRVRRQPGVLYAIDACPELFNARRPPRLKTGGGVKGLFGSKASLGLRPEQQPQRKSEPPTERF
jgi:hypothetical protein